MIKSLLNLRSKKSDHSVSSALECCMFTPMIYIFCIYIMILTHPCFANDVDSLLKSHPQLKKSLVMNVSGELNDKFYQFTMQCSQKPPEDLDKVRFYSVSNFDIEKYISIGIGALPVYCAEILQRDILNINKHNPPSAPPDCVADARHKYGDEYIAHIWFNLILGQIFEQNNESLTSRLHSGTKNILSTRPDDFWALFYNAASQCNGDESDASRRRYMKSFYTSIAEKLSDTLMLDFGKLDDFAEKAKIKNIESRINYLDQEIKHAKLSRPMKLIETLNRVNQIYQRATMSDERIFTEKESGPYIEKYCSDYKNNFQYRIYALSNDVSRFNTFLPPSKSIEILNKCIRSIHKKHLSTDEAIYAIYTISSNLFSLHTSQREYNSAHRVMNDLVVELKSRRSKLSGAYRDYILSWTLRSLALASAKLGENDLAVKQRNESIQFAEAAMLVEPSNPKFLHGYISRIMEASRLENPQISDEYVRETIAKLIRSKSISLNTMRLISDLLSNDQK